MTVDPSGYHSRRDAIPRKRTLFESHYMAERSEMRLGSRKRHVNTAEHIASLGETERRGGEKNGKRTNDRETERTDL